ncbi:MAG: BrnT family toxin [Thermodesulfobacteriota bacterium]
MMRYTAYDEIRSRAEDRWITLGKDRNDVLLVVVHTFLEIDGDNCSIRIISARLATRHEAKQYSAS